MYRNPRLDYPRVCRILVNSEKEREWCVKAFKILNEVGVVLKPSGGMERRTLELLEEKGVLQKVRIELCSPVYGRRSYVAYILNTDLLHAIYEVLRSLRTPPVCLHPEDVEKARLPSKFY